MTLAADTPACRDADVMINAGLRGGQFGTNTARTQLSFLFLK
jgi:hypothetical protein